VPRVAGNPCDKPLSFTPLASKLCHPAIILGLIVLWISPVTVAQGQDTPNRLTVATYNVENLLDAFDDPHTFDEATPAKPHEKIRQVAAVIRQLDADVLALQEVENQGVLRAMVREFLSDMGYRYIVVEPTNSRHGLNMAVISRCPIVNITSHRLLELKVPGLDHPRRFARDLLRVRITPSPTHGDNKPLDLYVVHFKSKRDSANDPQSAKWRLAEAAASKAIIHEALTADLYAQILLLGDLNDIPGSPTLLRLTHHAHSEQPTLTDLHAHLPLEQRITYLRPPHRSAIDYILASPALVRHVVPGSARVIPDTRSLDGSDHAPVVVTFDLTPPPP